MEMMRWVLAIIAIVILASVSVAGYGWHVFNRSLPQTAGELELPDLHGPVQILRDGDGVAHIFATDRHDLLMAQGFVHAQDKFFTMDFYRRVARGELSALVGADGGVVENDILMQTMGFSALAARDYAALDTETRDLLDAFAAGVNGWISGRKPGAVALEYSALGLAGLEPDIPPWRADDSLAVSRLSGFALSGRDAQWELRREAVAKAVTPEMYAQWRPGYDYDLWPTVFAPDDLAVMNDVLPSGPQADPVQAGNDGPTGTDNDPAPAIDRFFDLLPFADEGAGSNTWVVDGTLSKSGKPMLAVDPHNGIEMPNMWHEIGLNIRPAPGSDEAAISMYGFAAAPFFLILEGSNDYGAWGTTNVTGGDPFDLFRLTLNPENPDQYLLDGSWRSFETETKTIRIAGAEPREFSVRTSAFGPVLPSESGLPVYAVRWSGFAPSAIARAGLNLPFVRSFEDLRSVLADWDVPPTHFAWAGRDGSIGMQQAGRFPVRPFGADGSLPQDGSKSENDWIGYLDAALMPWVKDPAGHYISSGNNPVVPPAWFEATARANAINGDIDYLKDGARGYRAARSSALLESLAPHDAASFTRIQTDVTVPGLAESLQVFAGLGGENVSGCSTALTDWSGDHQADSAGALIFAKVWTRILDEVYAPHLPENVPVDVGMTELMSLQTIISDPESGWWDNPATPQVEGRDARLSPILEATCSDLAAAFGDDPANWRWDSVHAADFVSPVLGQSGIGFLEDMANRRGVKTFGGAGTVSISRWKHGKGFGPEHIPGYRYVIDLGQPDEVHVINSTGQSAHPASAHYADQMDDWAAGRYRTRALDEESVRARAVSVLNLFPETRNP